MDRLVEEWAFTSPGWNGPWRLAYMDPETEKKSKLTAMHDLHFYSVAWMRAATNRRLAKALSQLLGDNVELHHTTMHIKPPQTGHPFPMHQDNPFYGHKDGRFIDVLVHLDDTFHENGEIRFLDGSHKMGSPCSRYRDRRRPLLSPPSHRPVSFGGYGGGARPRPAMLCSFCIDTVHGSYINQTKNPRRLVRMGFRDPQNRQEYGQSMGRPGVMVSGYRERKEGDELLPIA